MTSADWAARPDGVQVLAALVSFSSALALAYLWAPMLVQGPVRSRRVAWANRVRAKWGGKPTDEAAPAWTALAYIWLVVASMDFMQGVFVLTALALGR